ncbi:conserved hypothetical protein [Paenibacillus curdlanolyticus YK9]|uniref:Integral membrane protein n=1 Tax=Paenibacillus curdlanolyticus YK9 TaxID=717606 RepID=E0I9D9_9BACL|nr:DUF2269 family protein [Paenibacillus curdlanolyticus]EFM11023.1 conserved hypothetical protein [Paenibacillus curdlanolyticus YK9]
MYNYLLFIHILSAITAVAAVICYPIIMSSARTVGQAKFALSLLEKTAILPKLGGTLLLLTGLAIGFQETYLFRERWYVASIVIFLVILVIFAGLLPAGIKQQLKLLLQTQGDNLPEVYRLSRRRSAWLEVVANLAVFISILLMVFKP